MRAPDLAGGTHEVHRYIRYPQHSNIYRG